MQLDATITRNTSHPGVRVLGVDFDLVGKSITIRVALQNGDRDDFTIRGQNARDFVRAAISGVRLEAVLTRAVRLAVDQKYSVTSSVPPGGGVDDQFP